MWLVALLEALDNNLVKLDHYNLVDIAFGLQRNDGHSLVVYKTFSETAAKQVEKLRQIGRTNPCQRCLCGKRYDAAS